MGALNPSCSTVWVAVLECSLVQGGAGEGEGQWGGHVGTGRALLAGTQSVPEFVQQLRHPRLLGATQPRTERASHQRDPRKRAADVCLEVVTPGCR